MVNCLAQPFGHFPIQVYAPLRTIKCYNKSTIDLDTLAFLRQAAIHFASAYNIIRYFFVTTFMLVLLRNHCLLIKTRYDKLSLYS